MNLLVLKLGATVDVVRTTPLLKKLALTFMKLLGRTFDRAGGSLAFLGIDPVPEKYVTQQRLVQLSDSIIKADDLVLATGAAGFIGSRVIELLPERGCRKVRCFARLSGQRRKSYLEHFISPVSLAKQYLGDTSRNLRRFLANDFHMKSGMNVSIEGLYESVRGNAPVPIPYGESLRTARITDAVFAPIGSGAGRFQSAGDRPAWLADAL